MVPKRPVPIVRKSDPRNHPWKQGHSRKRRYRQARDRAFQVRLQKAIQQEEILREEKEKQLKADVARTLEYQRRITDKNTIFTRTGNEIRPFLRGDTEQHDGIIDIITAYMIGVKDIIALHSAIMMASLKYAEVSFHDFWYGPMPFSERFFDPKLFSTNLDTKDWVSIYYDEVYLHNVPWYFRYCGMKTFFILRDVATTDTLFFILSSLTHEDHAQLDIFHFGPSVGYLELQQFSCMLPKDGHPRSLHGKLVHTVELKLKKIQRNRLP